MKIVLGAKVATPEVLAAIEVIGTFKRRRPEGPVGDRHLAYRERHLGAFAGVRRGRPHLRSLARSARRAFLQDERGAWLRRPQPRRTQ